MKTTTKHSNAWFQPTIILAILALVWQVYQYRHELDQDRLHREKEEHQAALVQARSMAPFLSVVTPITEPRVRVTNGPFETPWAVGVGKRMLLDRRKERFPEERRRELGRVGVIRNSGGGPAFNCRVRWNLDSAYTCDGRLIQRKDLRGDQLITIHTGEGTHTQPMQVPSGGEAEIIDLPNTLENGVEGKITHVGGQVEISCTDILGESHRYYQRVDAIGSFAPLDSAYERTGDIWVDTPGIKFFFGRVVKADGPFPFESGDIIEAGEPLWLADPNGAIKWLIGDTASNNTKPSEVGESEAAAHRATTD